MITQGTGTPCFFRMLTTVVLSYLKTNFGLKCLQTSLTCISLCQISLDPSIFISLLRLMIGINYYVLCCLGRCGVTPLHMVGTIDREDRSNIYCGKLAFKRMSLVLEAYYWYKLSIFCSLHTICLD